MHFRAEQRTNVSRRWVWLFVPVGAIASLLAGLMIGISNSSSTVALTLAGAAIGVIVLAVVLQNWRNGVLMLFALLVIEDSIRKYTGSLITLYAIKDVLLIAIYVSYFVDRGLTRKPLLTWRNPVLFLMGMLLLLGILSSLTSGERNWMVNIVGFRMWFIYFPLILVGIDFAKSPVHVRRLLILLVASFAIVHLLALLQIIFGNAILNPTNVSYAAKLSLEKVGVTGLSFVRPTSVFIDPGRYGKYAILSLCIITGVFIYFWIKGQERKSVVILIGLVWALNFLMSLLNGARTALVAAPAIIATFFLIMQIARSDRKGQKSRRRNNLLPTALAALVITGGMVAFTAIVSPNYLLATLDFAGTTIPYFGDHYELHTANMASALGDFRLLGSGMGSASIGVTYFIEEQLFQGIETGYASIVLEFGPLGLLVWIALGVLLIRATLRAARTLLVTPYFPLVVATLMVQALFLFILFVLGSAIYQDYLVSAHLWFLSGLIIGLAANDEPTQRPAFSRETGTADPILGGMANA